MEAAAVIGLVKADSCTGSSGVPRDNPPQPPSPQTAASWKPTAPTFNNVDNI